MARAKRLKIIKNRVAYYFCNHASSGRKRKTSINARPDLMGFRDIAKHVELLSTMPTIEPRRE